LRFRAACCIMRTHEECVCSTRATGTAASEHHQSDLSSDCCPQVPGLEPTALDNAVNTVTADNLDLGCRMIEKAAHDKAVTDIDARLAAGYTVRVARMTMQHHGTKGPDSNTDNPCHHPPSFTPTQLIVIMAHCELPQALPPFCKVALLSVCPSALSSIVQARKNAKAAGQAFYDVNVLQALAGTLGSTLPESLRPRACALSPHQVGQDRLF
jgi:hypothetical protein